MANFTRISNGLLRSFAESGALPSIYDQTFTPGGTVTTGTAVTLPASGTYTSAELRIFINQVLAEPGIDYNYVGSAPRTQVTFTFDLLVTDRVRFLIDRNF